MALLEKILNSEKEALKKGERLKVEVLRYLRSLIKNQEIAKGQSLEEREIIQIIRKEIKNLKEIVEKAKLAKRAEISSKSQAEIKILEEFLPKELSEEELDKFLKDLIAKNLKFPEIMAKSVKEIGERCAPERIAKRLKELLAQK
jgi:uncharacterized protein YqeY